MIKNYPSLFDVFDDSFDRFFSRPFNLEDMHPIRADIREKDGNYIFEIDLPGFKKEDINIDLKDGYLCVNAKRNDSKENKDEKGNILRKERIYGTVHRHFFVGSTVKSTDIKAKHEDGVLTIVVPKNEPEKLNESAKIMIE